MPQGIGQRGLLRNRLLLQKRVETTDANTGNTAGNWTDVQWVWAMLASPSVAEQVASGREELGAATMEQRRPHAITVDGAVPVDHTSRFKTVDGRVFDVLTVVPDEHSHRLKRVQAMERVGAK